MKVPVKQRKSKAYLKWLSQFNCLICDIYNSNRCNNLLCTQETVVPHHLPNKDHTRRYADYNQTVPLCAWHHTGRMGVHKNPHIEQELLETFKKCAEAYTKEYFKYKRTGDLQ